MTAPAYIPLRYTIEAKYPNKTGYLKNLAYNDFVPLLIAYAVSVEALVALPLLFISFFAIYEAGYVENDRVAAIRETQPTQTGQAHRFAAYPISQAYGWSLATGAAGIALLRDGPEIAYALALWVGWLAMVRLMFGLYNRSRVHHRPLLYPILQVLRRFSYLVPMHVVTPSGLAVLAAQTIWMSIRYAIYRGGGNIQALPDLNAVRAGTVLLLVALSFLPGMAPDPIRVAAVAAWLMYPTLRFHLTRKRTT